MAQKVLVSLVDDIDGTEAKETVLFGLDGVTYEIDLNEKNAAGLRKALDKYVPAGRKVGKGATLTKAPAKASGTRRPRNDDAQVIREWAVAQGMPVNERGRIAAEIRSAYEAAHKA